MARLLLANKNVVMAALRESERLAGMVEHDHGVPTGTVEPGVLISTISTVTSGPRCRHCGAHDQVDLPIHEGRSIRRDCGGCGRFIGFPKWYGTAT